MAKNCLSAVNNITFFDCVGVNNDIMSHKCSRCGNYLNFEDINIVTTNEEPDRIEVNTGRVEVNIRCSNCGCVTKFECGGYMVETM